MHVNSATWPDAPTVHAVLIRRNKGKQDVSLSTIRKRLLIMSKNAHEIIPHAHSHRDFVGLSYHLILRHYPDILFTVIVYICLLCILCLLMSKYLLLFKCVYSDTAISFGINELSVRLDRQTI